MTKPRPSSLISRISRRVFRVPTYARNHAALRTLLAHSTPRRLFNLLLVEAEFRLRRTRLNGRPYVLVVDPTNVCNLRCPLCPTGLLQQGRKGQMISWETFTRAVDMLAPWAFKVNMFNWGEPLLHSHISEMIRYAHGKNLGTSLSSNLSIELEDENIDDLIKSGLEFICVSIDGATQDTYARYRRKGNLDLVLKNLRRLVRRRQELGSRTPVIEWQFIPMKHNEHEVEAARRMASEIGVDHFRCIPVGLPFDSPNPAQLKQDWFPMTVTNGQIANGEEISSNEQSRTACYFLYRYLVVNPDGRTSPCCVVSGEKNDFGVIAAGNFDTLWNNSQYRSGRAQYSIGGKIEVPTVCDGCNLFAKRAKIPGSDTRRN
jgi:MoaA/NifB/PqqE/SkfB family radical SAM enzyme